VAANVFFATKSAATGTFNIGFGRGIAINELANRIIRLTGSSSSIQHSQERPGDIRHSVADIAKLRAAGFHPTGDFEDRLRQTVEHFSAMQCR
jgi:dTDP-D-glucose 4,6-dehydratase